MAGEKILIIDDEAHIVELIKYNLESNGYKAYTSYNGSDGLKSAEENPVDLIILDLMLPDMDGLEVCKALKRKDETASIPIIMLTAKSSEFDKILGLELGADDYVTKPFSVRELMARVKVILRRSFQDNVESKVISIGDLKIDLAKYQVSKNGKKLGLTLKEFELLRLMSSNRGKVFTREMLLESIWGYDYCGDTRTVDVHIRHLRQKIEDDDNNPKYIETIRGIGYRFSDTCK
jgi:two-component system alkaline phosphatase synthesis response regulator PhoP